MSPNRNKRLSMLPSKYLAFMAVFVSFAYLLICPFLNMPTWYAIFPFVLMTTKGIDVTFLNGLLLSAFWITYTLILTSPLYFIIGRYTWLSIYLPIVGVVFHKEPHEEATWLFLTIEKIFWDIPLLFWIRAVSWTGGRALKPFYSQINDTVAVGSIPLACDVATLRNVHQIDLVVNMCREYSGPVSEYARHNVMHVHIPTPDVCEPFYYDILMGLKTIQEHKKRINTQVKTVITKNTEDNARIFVHCKAGRGRATTFALCYLIFTGSDPQEAMELLKLKRPVVELYVLKFKVVERFIRFHKVYLGDLDLMIQNEELVRRNTGVM